MKVIGKMFYESDYQGKHYSGIKFYVTEQRPSVEGLFADVLKIPVGKPRYDEICKIPVGSEIIPIYNRYGNVEDVQVVEVKKSADTGK